MVLILLTYKKALEEVEKYIPAHIEFLDKQYRCKKFIFSGRKEPRSGGVILANNCNRQEVEIIIQQDPFYINSIAEYEIIEFIPSKYDDNFKCFL